MTHSTDYRDRHRRSRRRDQRVFMYVLRSIVTTAALVAIAFAFDLPEKTRDKLRAPAPEPSVVRRESAAEAKQQPPAEEPSETQATIREERAPVQPNLTFDRQSAGPSARELATRPESPVRSPVPASNTEPIDSAQEYEDLGRRVRLSLDKKLLRIPLVELAPDEESKGRVRVIALRKLEEKTELVPKGGIVGSDVELQILFPDYPRARLLVRMDKIGQRNFLIVEPQMALWAEKPMPFTLDRIKHEAHKTKRSAEEFFATLATNKTELPRLVNWLNTAQNIPLAEHKRGKARVQELQVLINQMESRVEQMNQAVEQMTALERLAQVLHEQAELQFVVTDSR